MLGCIGGSSSIAIGRILLEEPLAAPPLNVPQNGTHGPGEPI